MYEYYSTTQVVLPWPTQSQCSSHPNSEFCGHNNYNIDVAMETVPNVPTVDYLLSAAKEAEPDNEAPEKEVAVSANKGNHKSSLVIFAIDVSGSMSCTTEVPALQGG